MPERALHLADQRGGTWLGPLTGAASAAFVMCSMAATFGDFSSFFSSLSFFSLIFS